MWVQQEEEGSSCEVAEQQLLRVLPHEYSQRQDKEGNPHGEHAHDVWIPLDPVPAWVFRGTKAGRTADGGGS